LSIPPVTGKKIPGVGHSAPLRAGERVYPLLRYCLKIPELIDFFIGEGLDHVMQQHQLDVKEFGQTIIRVGETGRKVESTLGL